MVLGGGASQSQRVKNIGGLITLSLDKENFEVVRGGLLNDPVYCSKKRSVAQIQEYTTSLTFRMFLMILKYFKGHRISLVVTGMLQNTSGILQSILKSLETF